MIPLKQKVRPCQSYNTTDYTDIRKKHRSEGFFDVGCIICNDKSLEE